MESLRKVQAYTERLNKEENGDGKESKALATCLHTRYAARLFYPFKIKEVWSVTRNCIV